MNYNYEKPIPAGFTCGSAAESFFTLLEKNGLHFTNPMGKTLNVNAYNGAGGYFKGVLYTMSEAAKKWQELEDGLIKGKLLIIRKIEPEEKKQGAPPDPLKIEILPDHPFLTPRIKCIEPFLGMKQQGWEHNLVSEIGNGEDYQFLISLPKSFPYNFKLLKWYDERKFEEMVSIKYVKIIRNPGYWVVGDIVPVTNYIFNKIISPFIEKYEIGKGHHAAIADVEPATVDQYLEFCKINKLSPKK